jgi:hypothetical protein
MASSQYQEHLLQLDDHVRERQRGPGELQGADQRQAVGDHGRGRDERPLGVVEDEHPDDQERDEVRDAPRGVQDDAEDQPVDGDVEQRGQDLPQLPEAGLGVHRDVARRREGHDEAPPAPELAQVGQDGRARGARPQAVQLGVVGQRGGRQVGGQDTAGGHAVALLEHPGGAQAPVAPGALIVAHAADLMP